jgi:hypothetical protein
VGNAGQKPLTLRLAQTSEPFRRVNATAVPIEEREYLARMLYVLPPKTLSALRVAIGEKHIYVLDPSGIEGLPLGRFFSEVATRIYVPAGSRWCRPWRPKCSKTWCTRRARTMCSSTPRRPSRGAWPTRPSAW